jgi:hypothetical protein
MEGGHREEGGVEPLRRDALQVRTIIEGCLRAPQITALASDTGPLQLSLFDGRDLAEITSPDFPGERLACRNPALAEERARKREELLQATERRLTRLSHAVRRKPAKHDAGVIGLAVGAVIDKHKMKKHFALDIADGHFTFQRRRSQPRHGSTASM